MLVPLVLFTLSLVLLWDYMADIKDPFAPPVKPKSFEVDQRIHVKLDPELAVILGEVILDSNTTNPALRALGHQLNAILGPPE